MGVVLYDRDGKLQVTCRACNKTISYPDVFCASCFKLYRDLALPADLALTRLFEASNINFRDSLACSTCNGGRKRGCTRCGGRGSIPLGIGPKCDFCGHVAKGFGFERCPACCFLYPVAATPNDARAAARQSTLLPTPAPYCSRPPPTHVPKPISLDVPLPNVTLPVQTGTPSWGEPVDRPEPPTDYLAEVMRWWA